MAGVPTRTSARSRSLTSPRTTIGFIARMVATGVPICTQLPRSTCDVVDGAGEGRDHVEMLDGGLGLAELRLGRGELGAGDVGGDLGALAALRAATPPRPTAPARWASSALAVSTAASFSGPSRLRRTLPAETYWPSMAGRARMMPLSRAASTEVLSGSVRPGDADRPRVAHGLRRRDEDGALRAVAGGVGGGAAASSASARSLPMWENLPVSTQAAAASSTRSARS